MGRSYQPQAIHTNLSIAVLVLSSCEATAVEDAGSNPAARAITYAGVAQGKSVHIKPDALH